MGKIDFNDEDGLRVDKVKDVAEEIGEILLTRFEHDASGFANILTTITLVARSMAMTSSLSVLLRHTDVTDEEIKNAALATIKMLGQNIADTDNVSIDMEGSIRATRKMIERRIDGMHLRDMMDINLN